MDSLNTPKSDLVNVMASARDAMKAVVAEKMHLFGSAGKAWSTNSFVMINGVTINLCSFLIKNITASLIHYLYLLEFNKLLYFLFTSLTFVLFVLRNLAVLLEYTFIYTKH